MFHFNFTNKKMKGLTLKMFVTTLSDLFKETELKCSTDFQSRLNLTYGLNFITMASPERTEH